VAAGRIPIRTVLGPEHLALKEVAVDTVPDGAVAELADALEKVSLYDLYPGEVILAQRLMDPNVIAADGHTALALAEDQVLMAIPADNLMGQAVVLRPGDHIDIHVSLGVPEAFPQDALSTQVSGTSVEEDRVRASFSALENVQVVAILGEQGSQGGGLLGGGVPDAVASPVSILVTLNPQDALVLKYAVDAEGVLDYVLRAPEVDRPFDTEPVDLEYLINRYEIPTGSVLSR